jgi:zinc protease
MEAAYVALPYHHPTIGWKSDIEHVPLSKLREFYDTFYWPNNAVLTVVGDFESDPVLGMIKKYYGVYPHSPSPIPTVYTEEPAQTGERRVIVKRPGELGTVILAHKVPNGRDADQPALEMLDAILSSGKNGRLYRTLVDQGLALSAGAGIDLLHDLSLHTLYAALTPGTTHEQIENALAAELNKIKANGVTPAEVASVKQQFIAEDAYKRDGTAAIASELSEWIGVGDWTLYVTFPQRVQQVTPADVQRVAKQYFSADQSTVGWFVPVAPKTEKGS